MGNTGVSQGHRSCAGQSPPRHAVWTAAALSRPQEGAEDFQLLRATTLCLMAWMGGADRCRGRDTTGQEKQAKIPGTL